MTWKGVELITIRDLMEHGVDKCDTPEEAAQFMALYRSENKYADANIGYLSGYYGATEMKRIQKWFGVSHPIFGRRMPTMEEAFDAGFVEGVTQIRPDDEDR